MLYKVGSNQYRMIPQTRTRLHREAVKREQNRVFGLKTTTLRDINFVCGLLLIVCYFGHQVAIKDVDLHRHLISPISMTAYAFDSVYTVPPLAPVEERSQVKDLIRKIWGRDASTGLAIARCESGYRVQAVNHNTNKTDDQGVFQVNTVHNMPDMFNATANIAYAYTIYEAQGVNPWLSSKSCWGGEVSE